MVLQYIRKCQFLLSVSSNLTFSSSLVSEVLQEWEGIVNRVAKMEVGEKVIVCGRSARWWDSEIKERIALHEVASV